MNFRLSRCTPTPDTVHVNTVECALPRLMHLMLSVYPAQAALVRRLAALYDDICSYNVRMDQHHAAVADYQVGAGPWGGVRCRKDVAMSPFTVAALAWAPLSIGTGHWKGDVHITAMLGLCGRAAPVALSLMKVR